MSLPGEAFIAGAKWQKEQDEKEQADLFTIVALDAAQRAKEQMMKEAVDATVIAMKSGDKYCQAYITGRNSLANMCNGDHVKLIIVKEVK